MAVYFMMQSLTYNITLFAATLSLLTSFGQLFLRGRKEENENLFILFFILGIILLQAQAIVTGTIYEHASLFFLNMTFMSLLGPVLFRAYYYVNFPVSQFPYRHGLIFLPTLPVFAVDLYFLSMSTPEKAALINTVLHGTPTTTSRFMESAYLLSMIQGTILLSLLIHRLLKEIKDNRFGAILYINTSYTLWSMGALIIADLGVLLGSLPMIQTGIFLAAALLIGAYLVGFRYPEFLQLFFVSAVTAGRNRPLTAGIEVEKIHKDLMVMMNDEMIYREEDISLQSLADELSITPHQLSYIINTNFNMNFNNFINSYRIEEVRRRLLETPEQSILSIAHEVGFNSKSAFYAAFTHFTGMTPTRFRKKNSPAG